MLKCLIKLGYGFTNLGISTEKNSQIKENATKQNARTTNQTQRHAHAKHMNQMQSTETRDPNATKT